MRRGGLAACVSLLTLGGCDYQNYQSMVGGAGTESRQFLSLFTIFLIVCAVMYLAVILFLAVGILRRRREQANVVETGNHHQSHPLMRTGLIAWGGVVATGLVALAIASFFSDRSMARAAGNEKLSITVTANQWWWDVRYNASDASKIMRTANELYLPVGIPVRIYLRSNDVIHSFWVPSLAGKQDLIPGRENDITITPQKIGIFRGQCAEFCGTQHAKMALVVNVVSYGDFIRWWDAQLRSPSTPTAPLLQAGYNYVVRGQCSACHNVAGTPASGTVGPDLTHLASRRSIGAGSLPMSEANLAGWVRDPQAIKPGNKMPTIAMKPDDLHAVVAYLETLK